MQALQISKWALISWFEGALIYARALIKFFSCEKGAHSKEAFI